jgi:endonuclease/exonuclease/phosphatase family metal-dependent hydrolase
MSEAPRAGPWLPDPRVAILPPAESRLRLLSYNIHVGTRPEHYGHYVTRAWRHALPGPGMHGTLDAIAELMQQYDFVAVQEADAGSLRTRFVNQLEYLAKRAGFAHMGHVVTRDLRPIARHALGYLSRLPPTRLHEHVLPTRIPGRRALSVHLGPEAGGLNLLIAHLSLGRPDRHRQLDYLAQLVSRSSPTVLLGDLNCEAEALREHGALTRQGIWIPRTTPVTFPSWRPRWSLDHILTTPHVSVHRVESLPHLFSDHLPIHAEVSVPLLQKSAT